LFQSGYFEDATIAAELSFSKKKHFEPEDFKVFEKWIKSYVNNWSSCDKFCNHTVGALLIGYPNSLRYLKIWAKSKHRWLKRAAAVSLIVPARQGLHTDTIFEVAGILLNDNDEFVQKGYGWLLKEASKHRQEEVFEFVMKHKQSMPRLSLRYAIEHFPPELKTLAMVR
jgi:3-methyladenine DNA glycosylase AlkD